MIHTRYFECKVAGSNKFWEICWNSTAKGFVTRWGKIGQAGTQNPKTFVTREDRNDARDKIIAEKLAKGYVEVKPTKIAKADTVAVTPTDPKLPDYLEIW